MIDAETLITQFATRATAYGIELPGDATAALDCLAAVRTAATGLTPEDAAATAAGAVAAGKVTTKTAAAQVTDLATRMLAADKAREAAQLFTHPLLSRARYAIRAHRDDLVQAMRDPFDRTATRLHEIGRQIEPGLSPRRLIETGGSQAVALHEQATGNGAALGALLDIYRDLLRLTGTIAELDATWVLDPASVADVAALDRARFAFASPKYQREGPADRFHSLVHAGFRLRLNLPSEARALANTVRQTARAEAERQQLAARLARQRNQPVPVGGDAA